jgi:hypothetical protein
LVIEVFRRGNRCYGDKHKTLEAATLSEKELEDLELKLARGQISKDDYWEEIRILERGYQDFESERAGLYKTLSEKGISVLFFLLPLMAALFLLYLIFFYYPTPGEIDIQVSGTEIIPATSGEKKAIYRGLELLRQYSPADYNFVLEHVDKVEVAGPYGFSLFGKIRGYYRGGPEGFGRTVRIVRIFDCPVHCDEDDWHGGDLLIAGFIVHEACHSMQHQNSLELSEKQCYEMQFDFADKVGPHIWPDFNREVFIYDYTSQF